MTLNETETFRLMCRGDESAFEYFFRKYYKRLLGYSIEMLKDSVAAEEIVEDLFAHIWETRARIDLQGSPASYLFRTAHNFCLNYLKHKKVEDKYQSFAKQQLAFAELESTHNSFPLSTLIDKEITAQLEHSIDKLPEQCKLIFRMSRLEGKKNHEIAEDLQISVNTVKTQLIRALERLRKDLKRHFIVLFFRR